MSDCFRVVDDTLLQYLREKQAGVQRELDGQETFLYRIRAGTTSPTYPDDVVDVKDRICRLKVAKKLVEELLELAEESIADQTPVVVPSHPSRVYHIVCDFVTALVAAFGRLI